MGNGSDTSLSVRSRGGMLRWSFVALHLNGSGALIQVTEGKTKAARRMLPMGASCVCRIEGEMDSRGPARRGLDVSRGPARRPLNKDTAKDQHKRAIERANGTAKREGAKEIRPFEPYILRHTALTQLAKSRCDVLTLARLAGHSLIRITQRYVHHQADAIERALLQIENATLPALPVAGH